tara:strand:+ start:1009 stop:1470 length:462 start_codon:yes stop_codon:yes gene_type:complete
MNPEILFKVAVTSCEEVCIYGPTKEQLEKTKPIYCELPFLARKIINQSNLEIKKLKRYTIRNKYFKENRLEELDEKIKEIETLCNWKVRVLIEQKKKELKQERDACLLLEIAEKARKEQILKQRREERIKLREENTQKKANHLLRRSDRLKKI